jgi:hypothetical protein
MNSTSTQLPVPFERRDRPLPRRAAARAVPAAVALAALLATVAAAAAFVPWGTRYEAVLYRAVETSTVARYPQGFLVTGVLEGAALVLTTAITLLAVAETVAGSRIRTPGAATPALLTAAAFLAATVLPAAVLDGYLAVVPAGAAIAAGALARRPVPGTVTVTVGELAGWGAAALAADAVFSGLGILVAVVLAFTRLRRTPSAQRWGIGFLSLFAALVHVLTVGGGPLL